jgi:hypothetical protein
MSPAKFILLQIVDYERKRGQDCAARLADKLEVPLSHPVPKSGSMQRDTRISPDAMLIFLKQAALEDYWTGAYLGKALGLDPATAKQFAAEIALAGYAEPVQGKRETWRNTESGNTLAGVHPPRLKRTKAEELLTDLEDRAAQFAMKDPAEEVRLQSVVALGSILAEHDPIQDVDIGVKLEQSQDGEAIPHADQLAVMKLLKGRSAALKLHTWSDAMEHMPARVIWKA